MGTGGIGIVLGIQLRLVVHKTVVAKRTFVAVLRQRFLVAVAPLVGAPVIVVLGLGLAPGELVTIFLGCACAHVARRPQRAARQSQVDISI